ncbi:MULTISPECIES: hypothetical protein [Streptomyces]|uniref:Membrane protein YndG n=1 Tax=Streptomyces venezuelae TaxID=54571 RepID=A0A5P2BGF9_STRVZ|nr:hypothetical protein [Streptomyces venezuelae]MYY84241.1 hypothetical protein [Streptomyces sp. SID335]MYZ19047.1 hypothetical protein [Streptomyces sp. SID337]NDZ84560.1 hypothetical protein [Streptomyces sp. SID10115]NEA04296.1 hypothetical protein [Streptomyces sp. SID10116]NEB50503.1 hypothetical protein [Streptomyces sp. SID339]
MSLYIEARIRADLDDLWARTQEPDQHRRWDLRFGEIDYLPCAEGEPQRFRYATRVLPFLTVAGTGVSAGEKRRPDGTRTSALRFASPHPLSLLEEGSGYWRYVPAEDGDGVRFLTGYDYRPRWGRFGEIADRLVFRPVMGWATAWSFDRLRLWLERGVTPERALAHAVAECVVRLLCVAAAVLFVPVVALAVAASVLVLPPLPTTPAARRCLRKPPVRAREPRVLSGLGPLTKAGGRYS